MIFYFLIFIELYLFLEVHNKTPEEMNQKVTLMQNKKETKAKEIKIAMS